MTPGVARNRRDAGSDAATSSAARKPNWFELYASRIQVIPRSSTTSRRFETGLSVRIAATITSGSTPSADASV